MLFSFQSLSHNKNDNVANANVIEQGHWWHWMAGGAHYVAMNSNDAQWHVNDELRAIVPMTGNFIVIAKVADNAATPTSSNGCSADVRSVMKSLGRL
jgi:hypothetical protein